MMKKLLATAGLAAGLALLAPNAAFADTGDVYKTLNPGQSFCARDSKISFYTARGEGAVLSGHPVRFTFGTYSPTVRTPFDTFSPVSAVAFDANLYNTTNLFSGQFQLCAINQSQKVSSVRLHVYGQ